jgi:hypothetical protein
VSIRVGPGTVRYNSPVDNQYGMQYIKQAYATWKPAAKLTLDFGKWDQPYGSEVADSQLNLNYSRSLLFTYAQPLFFTGLRVDYAASDNLDAKIFVANGWNNTIGLNRSKSAGVQLMIKPIDTLVLYVGDVIGPQQPDSTPFPGGPAAPAVANVPDANGHMRNLADLVVDYNPTSTLRVLANGDYGTEDSVLGPGSHNATWYGANVVVKYAFSDPFFAALRGEYFHDEHGDVLGTGTSTNVESLLLTLSYSIGTKLMFMFDNRVDVADNPIFHQNATDTAKAQVTSILGVIVSTK